MEFLTTCRPISSHVHPCASLSDGALHVAIGSNCMIGAKPVHSFKLQKYW